MENFDSKILYYGQATWGSTSLQRYNVLKDIFSSIYLVDSRRVFPDKGSGRTLFNSLQVRLGVGRLVDLSSKILMQEVERYKPDLVWIDGGYLVDPSTIRHIKKRNIKVIHYTPDSLFAPGLSNSCFRKAIREYDHIVTTKTQDLNTYKKYKAKNILLSQQGFDPSIHKKVELNEEDLKFRSDVVFIGHCMKDRLKYIEYLLKHTEFKLKIFGTGWDAIKIPQSVKECFHGPALGIDYAKAINGSKICLGFLNNEAYDEITTRSFEIPSSGGFLLAERTEQHTNIFIEDVEAVFFSTEEELVKKIQHYLNNDHERNTIRDKGYKRILNGNYSWNSLIRDILIQVLD